MTYSHVKVPFVNTLLLTFTGMAAQPDFDFGTSPADVVPQLPQRSTEERLSSEIADVTRSSHRVLVNGVYRSNSLLNISKVMRSMALESFDSDPTHDTLLEINDPLFSPDVCVTLVSLQSFEVSCSSVTDPSVRRSIYSSCVKGTVCRIPSLVEVIHKYECVFLPSTLDFISIKLIKNKLPFETRAENETFYDSVVSQYISVIRENNGDKYQYITSLCGSNEVAADVMRGLAALIPRPHGVGAKRKLDFGDSSVSATTSATTSFASSATTSATSGTTSSGGPKFPGLKFGKAL
jgi:hypothetical protein